MKSKKIITALLILVMAFQLLPVRQAVKYFFIDNLMVEEMLDVSKGATKNFKLTDEDHNLPEYGFTLNHYFLVNNKISFHFVEMLPAIQTKVVHTPPPNIFFI